ncbi:MAGNESIUM TRANSPORTER-RELATED [Salix koriyanagi]|uniref:Probable magnesium transporter n=1 Tax=Salix koriyanagi TaxID=2511006 RepID=A0A9Q1ANM4_9ROSI|nr:MAGNESIUM TRANSPORTER-RELATED [Salix koriyanagi]
MNDWQMKREGNEDQHRNNKRTYTKKIREEKSFNLQMAFSQDNLKGFVLALSSSAFIGASFIIKKKGLRRAAAASGVRAGVGGFSYLLEPLWWLGMITMIVGEVANFVAYAFAPAVLVTPLGALSIIVSAVLAHFILNEKLHQLGILGCVMCIAGSIVIVIHAPQERPITSVQEIWSMAIQPAFLLYVGSVVVLVFIMIVHFAPQCGHSNVLVFTGICSFMGSLSVMSVKAVGTALKLTFEGNNQLLYPETWFFVLIVATCVITQMNYLNKALDTFNTAVVSPIYYVMFTSLTILASVIMFKVRILARKLTLCYCIYIITLYIFAGAFFILIGLHRKNANVASSC